MRRVAIQALVLVVLAVFVGGLWVLGTQPQLRWLRLYSVAVLAAGLAVAFWDHFLWRTKLAQMIPSVPRDLRGTWKGTLQSLWLDPASGAAPAPIPVFVVVRQSSTSTKVSLYTQQSASTSSLAAVSGGASDTVLEYLYLNVPSARFRKRSPIHNGAAALFAAGRPPARLTGHYWTGRDSRGEIELHERSKKFAGDFLSAQQLFSA